MSDSYSKFLDEKKARLEAATYCCPIMRRLRIEGMGGNYSIDWDDNILTVFGTFEGEDYDITPFKMICCMFCGTKLE